MAQNNPRKGFEQKMLSFQIGQQPSMIRAFNQVEPTGQQVLQTIYSMLEKSQLQPKNSTQHCKCKKTNCLKLYCQCFSRGQYCQDCNCDGCHNIPVYDDVRAPLVEHRASKEPYLFFQEPNKCVCKKTACIKKYCLCFNNKLLCGPLCKCINCSNCP